MKKSSLAGSFAFIPLGKEGRMLCPKCKKDNVVFGIIPKYGFCKHCVLWINPDDPNKSLEEVGNERKIESSNMIEHEVSKENQGASKFNTLAIIGLILSAISILGFGLVGLIGFILGITALIQIKYTSERGKGLAIAAIVIGFIWSIGVGILKKFVEAGY